jgi:tetratricopeptide (TPR) repeat protein
VAKFSRWINGVAVPAVLAMTAAAGWAQSGGPQKQVKDQAEFDLVDAVKKDMLAGNGAKAVEDLNAWKQHNPDSAFKDDREVMYLQSYGMAKQFDKGLLKAKELMSQNLDAMFPGPEAKTVINIYFEAVKDASQLPNPTPEQLAIGVDAAHKILDYKQVPAGIAPGDWTTAKKTLDDAANGMLYSAAIQPAIAAQGRRDWAAAEAAWTKAQGDYPDRSLIAYNLGISLRSQQKNDAAIWQFARAVAIDPTLGGGSNATTITNFVNTVYRNLHGSDEGFDQIKQQAKVSVTPPAGFHVQTATEIAEAKQKEFETSHPDIALWMKLKATLSSEQGQQYFDSGMKGAQVPELTGTVLESKCRARELQVAVPLPDATGAPVAEITLKLVNDAGAASPLTGKAETGRVTFQGVAEAFSKEPFMLTMTIEKKDIKDLKVTPCAAPAPVRKGPAKKK